MSLGLIMSQTGGAGTRTAQILSLVVAMCSMSSPALNGAGQKAAEGDQPTPPAASAPASAPFGAVEGIVRFQGEIPKSPVPDDAGLHRPLLKVDRQTRGLGSVVVHLIPIEQADSVEGGSGEADMREGPPIVVDQQDHEFSPRVVAVLVGQPVTFTNSDPANHNVRTSSPVAKNLFNVFTGVEGKYQHRFVAEPEQRPIRLSCDIHPWMTGWVYVLEHPYFSVTDERGRFRIGSVPPGRYKLILRQPDIRYTVEREIAVSAGQVAKIEIEIGSNQPVKTSN